MKKNERWLFLRQFVDATMHLAPIGDVGICCCYNFLILFRAYFSVRLVLPTNAGWCGASTGNAHYRREKKTFILLPLFAYA